MRKTLKSVLYVEDDIHVRTTAKLVLEVIGNIVVRDCGSGRDALLTARDFTPDLIVLDVMMPELDGVTTLEMLRRLPHLHDVLGPVRDRPDGAGRHRALHGGGRHRRDPQTAGARCAWPDNCTPCGTSARAASPERRGPARPGVLCYHGGLHPPGTGPS
ncbi:response regulator [Massilia sp. B-10]|nr:response regulator [Massilia sp. B-10]